MIVRAAPSEHLGWICERTGCLLSGAARAIECVDGDRIVGMVAYDLWTPNSVQAHMAADSPVAWRAMLRPAFEYPFNQAGKGVLLGVIAGDNAKSLHLAERFGFRETHRVRDGIKRGVDLVLIEMRREECRWILRQELRAA